MKISEEQSQLFYSQRVPELYNNLYDCFYRYLPGLDGEALGEGVNTTQWSTKFLRGLPCCAGIQLPGGISLLINIVFLLHAALFCV
jgi:hypothetical protein